jgi:hypothetical protein
LKVAVFLAEIYKIKQYNSNNYNGLGLFKEALITSEPINVETSG